MQLLFWIGIGVFILGFILRYVFKIKYYQDYKSQVTTDLKRQELKTKYRPKIFLSLALEVLGVIISFIDIWIES